MPRLPASQRRRYRLVQILQHQRAHAMANLQPNPTNQIGNQTIFFIQPPLPQEHQPLSWIEQALMGHPISFNMILNGQAMVIILQNSHFLAQLVSKGIHIVMNNYQNHIWLNNVLHPLTPSMNANQAHAIRSQWNLPHHFNHLPSQNTTMDLPFFLPGEISLMNLIFIPWSVA